MLHVPQLCGHNVNRESELWFGVFFVNTRRTLEGKSRDEVQSVTKIG